MVIGLIAVFCIVILIDMPGLLKTNHRIKGMIIYFFLLTTGFTISLLQMMDKAPISPSKIIENMIKFIIPGG
jgi:hypothetical protein